MAVLKQFYSAHLLTNTLNQTVVTPTPIISHYLLKKPEWSLSQMGHLLLKPLPLHTCNHLLCPLTSVWRHPTNQKPLPWDDHLYFSSATAPLSPPLAPIFPSSGPRNLNPLDPLDPLSPASSPSSGPRRVLYCPLCPRIFYYLSDLERHSITHSQNKPHVCLQCGKAFKRSSHLQRHKHIHTGERNFVCPICSKRFREAGELQRHQRVHTGEKPYQCPLCHTRFAERNTLRRHTRRKHPYHQAAMEMLSERGAGGGGREGGDGDEGTEEWYSSTVSNLDNSDSEPDSEVIS
ncbi:zinc finger protein 581-like [Oncorhynchus nerka]|uniref:zinc finger protein 581-like n=1 Tax=Oncorhynchus nerka TaxID=8023 RepID=UPI0031B7ECDB